jgi:diadenosine tetraphosphate (Ap4A) HIT family hydrolase
MRCPFCDIAPGQGILVAENERAVAFADAFPVSEGHTLVVPRRHVGSALDLSDAEWYDVQCLVREVARTLTTRTDVAGVNIGLNVGAAAGQTVDHAHVHVIPRTAGDVPDPRGGVRWVLPESAAYWEET